jgi:threonine/homoserine/homoserine lactone efflux protein
MNWELFAAFLLITTVLVITPGPIVTLVIATGAGQGIRAALTTVAGTTLGNALLLTTIAFGLSWVLENAATLFDILRWVGAAYLIWLGVQAWRHAGANGAMATPRGHVHFRRGITVALSNPKTIAFFTAFLPNSSIRACRPGASWRSCALFRSLWPQSRIPSGASRPGSAGHGSCSRGVRSCSADCPVSP